MTMDLKTSLANPILKKSDKPFIYEAGTKLGRKLSSYESIEYLMVIWSALETMV